MDMKFGVNLNNKEDVMFMYDYAKKHGIGLSYSFNKIVENINHYKGNCAFWNEFFVFPKSNFIKCGYKLVDIQELDIYKRDKPCKFMSKR